MQFHPKYVYMYVNTHEMSVLCVDVSTYLKNLHYQQQILVYKDEYIIPALSQGWRLLVLIAASEGAPGLGVTA